MRHAPTRLAVAVAALALTAAAACAPKVQPVEGDQGLPPPIPAPTTTQPGSTAPPPADKARAPGARPPSADSRPETGQPSPPATAPSPRTAQPPDDGARGPVGAFARTLLRPEPATAIVIDVVAEGRAAPSGAALRHATAVLAEVTGKRVTVTGPRRTAASGRRSWEARDIIAVADATVPDNADDRTAVVRVLYLEGAFGPDDSALGVAVRGDLFAVFAEQVRSAETPLVSDGAIEDAVVVHELGHLLGLVDLVIDTGRDDPDHPHHSRNRASVMYWAVESDLVGQVLTGGPPRDFDADDRRDLETIRHGP